MKKLAFAATAAALICFGPTLALAAEQWLVTEENLGGVKGGQGTWSVTRDGSKITGTAEIQADNGSMLTYKVEGEAAANGAYTITMSDRSDGKKGCVWAGHPPSGAGSQQRGLVGYAECEGTKMIVRASIFGQ
jgi:hypothetical protein